MATGGGFWVAIGVYSCLQISDEIDGYVYLLNPKTFTPDGDWEAWDFGSKIPGAFRYRSFWDMMRAGAVSRREA